jgi:TRAP-type C4-dicarboxylate transport system substrate-binding protein
VFSTLALGCASSPADKAGGHDNGKVTVLELANGDRGGRDLGPFIDAVRQLSHGSLEIRVRDNAHMRDTGYEQEIAQDVRSGRVAMGKVGARAWDLLGVDDFRPLVAPFVITSMEQQERVLRSPVANRMLEGLRRIGLRGIALLPGELRYPVGVTRDATRPSDFRGAVVGIRPSGMAEQTFATLGGKALGIVPGGNYDGVSIVEQDLQTLAGAPGLDKARSLTANLPLWPRMQTVVMNERAYSRLTTDQRRILAKAATTAIAPTLRQDAKSAAQGLAAICASNSLALVQIAPADAAAIRSAVAPVLDGLRENARAAAALRTIGGVAGGADTVRCPAGQDGRPAAAPPTRETAKTRIDGEWKADVTRAAYYAARPDAHEDNEANWGPLRLTLNRGRFAIENERFPGDIARGTYTVRGDRLLMAPEGTIEQGAEIWRYRWSRYRDTLQLHRAATTDMPTALRAVPWAKTG